MWRLTYNLLIHALVPLFLVFSACNKKIRKTFRERMFGTSGGKGLKDAIWLHAASLGEAVIAENFINYVNSKTRNPFLVTTNTYYTRDLLRKKFQDRSTVLSLPFDLPFSIKRFIGTSTFAALLIVETEIWPNLIWTASRKKIPVIIVNGRISDATIGRYRRFSFFLKNVLASVDLVLAQSEEQARRFVSLGMPPSKVITTGNLKYYRDVPHTDNRGSRENTVTFGSVKEKELPILMPVVGNIKRQFPAARIYIAPRELHLIDVLGQQLPRDLKVGRLSEMKQEGTVDHDIIIVDTVGQLVDIYARSSVAFVGGSLAPYGGQNLLEPLFVGTPVIFGPHIENFKAVGEDVLEQHAGFMVHGGPELQEKIALILTDEKLRESLASAGRAVVEKQRGVMEESARLVLEKICKSSPI